jgi:hypothetical protein
LYGLFLVKGKSGWGENLKPSRGSLFPRFSDLTDWTDHTDKNAEDKRYRNNTGKSEISPQAPSFFSGHAFSFRAIVRPVREVRLVRKSRNPI